MATSQLPQLGANADFDQVKSTMIQWQDYLNWFFRNLDSLNIKKLTSGTVIIYDLEGGSGTVTLTKDGMVINDGTKDTFKVDINGQVTMTGAQVQSSESSYPRIEMSSTNNLLTASLDSDSYIQIDADRVGTPTLVFQEGLENTLLAQIAGVGFSIIPTSGNMFINAQSGSLVLSGDFVRINSLFASPLDSIFQANSTAATVADLVTDFNTLLGNLRAMNILA